MGSLKKKTISGFLWMSVTSGFSSVAKILVLAILARLLSIDSFGIISAALIVVALASLFTQMGVGPAIVQKKKISDLDISMAFTISLALGGFSTVLVFFTSGSISSFFNMPDLTPVLQVLSILFLFESISVVAVSRMQRDLQFRKISLISLLSYIIGYGGVSISLAYLGFDLWSLVYGQLAQTILQVIFYAIYKPFKYRLVFDKESFKDLIHFGGGFTLAKFANYLALQGDNLITGKFLGAESLGLYSRAYSFIVMPITLIGSAMDSALFPVMSQMQDNNKKIKDIFYQGTGLISIVSFPISIVIYILSPEIVDILLGDNWSGVIIPLQVLSAGLLFRMLYRISDTLMKSLGHVYKRAIIQCVYAVVVLLTTFLLRGYGITGIALGVVISLFINFMLMSGLSMQILEANPLLFFKESIRGWKVGVVFFITLYPTVQVIRELTNSSILIFLTCVFELTVILLILIIFARKWFFNKFIINVIENYLVRFKLLK